MNDHEEDQAELAGLRARNHELRCENNQLRLEVIGLREDLAGKQTLATQLALAADEPRTGPTG